VLKLGTGVQERDRSCWGTEKDRDNHRLEPLNEKYEQNFELVALVCVSFLAMTVQRPF